MENGKLLDVHVFNAWQEIAKSNVTNTVVSRIFEIFVSFHYFIHAWSLKAYIV